MSQPQNLSKRVNCQFGQSEACEADQKHETSSGPWSLKGEACMFRPLGHIQKWLWDCRTLLKVIRVLGQTEGTNPFRDFNIGFAL